MVTPVETLSPRYAERERGILRLAPDNHRDERRCDCRSRNSGYHVVIDGFVNDLAVSRTPYSKSRSPVHSLKKTSVLR
jgi:hypothetical protein